MIAVPKWIDDTLRAFGKLMGLQNFGFNERNAAALNFENGIVLSFEYANGVLVVSAKISMAATSENMKQLLSHSRPVPGQRPLRTYYLNRTGQGGCAMVLKENEINVNTLEAIFQALWKTADYLRRNTQWQ